MAYTDYAQLIIDLFKAQWDEGNTDSSFTPEFSSEWFAESWNAQRVVFIKLLSAPHTIEDLGDNCHRVECLYQIDLYADARQDVLDMQGEIDRIINDNSVDPMTGVAFMTQQRWIDSSFLETNLYRLTLEMRTTMYVNT